MNKKKKCFIICGTFLLLILLGVTYFGMLCPDDYPRDFYFDKIQLNNKTAPFFAKDHNFIAKRNNGCQYDYFTQSGWTFTLKGYMFSDLFNLILDIKNKQCENCILIQNDGPWRWGQIREYSSGEICGDKNNWSDCI